MALKQQIVYVNPRLTVNTGPAIYDTDILYPFEKTFSGMVQDIRDEIDDATHEYDQQIPKCIRSAIRYCEREPFYFNENRDVILKTVANKGEYRLVDNKHIGTAVSIKSVYRIGDGNQIQMNPLFEHDAERKMDNDARGEPINYSYFDKTLYIFPTPDREYSLRLILSPMRFDEMTTTDEKSPWFDDAYDMIKYRAKHDLLKNFIKDFDGAKIALEDFQEQWNILKSETSRRSNVNSLVPWSV